ncbi:hypothetical protein A2715_05780 [Candidatus Woesebacteria bacterium RIFCSPHIGHO2_01_FULL_39_32]|uniref:UPF0102 protein A2893_05390 n=1 Tax=Candidatus Woesebacteria bacterium RIFCSPLOWO2_01_FULL_39_25 TaxID=1802521 RepID=A0A1F8BLW2_9BACT|nr:MAG: hypothetical protein A2124_00105 [Candidatus Woesebacteria bacterium GWB1_37_5]OGM25526.1 MAG: hypothetical protein A2715_05780 [Candidatus Woesebacteria bacterium RIFCSPHIGHO2_01_FULL_39_32]OGM36806.1 MAG: hypothetical protein A3F01_00255 [Candidatus Woesebacteria bacterium RIFCSPHIGHO2_12_FULL_38_11]OGM65057.1 MAG: hypothetical protein A2893_05390 [Candidatus Woesebacteria bacterium RIFCSPLOWO2_01_FULL_39_25]
MKGKRGWGQAGEEYATELLKKNGYTILERNYKSVIGEIDIIALDPSTGSGPDGTLVFVEVKTRWSPKFGTPQEAVNSRKLYKIKRVGEYYLMTHPTSPRKLRIDVVAIEMDKATVKSSKIIKVV